MAEETRTIIVERKNGDIFTISDIPHDAKITFGPLTPGAKLTRSVCLPHSPASRSLAPSRSR